MPLNTDLFFLYCANQIYTEQRTQEKNTMIQWMDKTDEMMLIKIIPWAACFVKMLGLIYKKRFGRTVLPITGSDFHFTNAKKGKILMGCYGNVDVLMNEAPIFCGWGGGWGGLFCYIVESSHFAWSQSLKPNVQKVFFLYMRCKILMNRFFAHQAYKCLPVCKVSSARLKCTLGLDRVKVAQLVQ